MYRRKIDMINNTVLLVALLNDTALLSFVRNVLITLHQGHSLLPPAVDHLDGVKYVCLLL